MEAFSIIFGILLFLLGTVLALAIYLIPSIIAVKTDHPNKTAIIVLNILGGWTFIVWVVSLVWALTKPAAGQNIIFQNQYMGGSAPQQAQGYDSSWFQGETGREAAYASAVPVLVGVNGQFAGKTIDLSRGQVSIGRDPQVSQLTYPHSCDSISRKHCIVGYDKNSRNFIIEDTSTNGTFIYPQERLRQGQPVYLQPGSRFFLGDPGELYEVTLG